MAVSSVSLIMNPSDYPVYPWPRMQGSGVLQTLKALPIHYVPSLLNHRIVVLIFYEGRMQGRMAEGIGIGAVKRRGQAGH